MTIDGSHTIGETWDLIRDYDPQLAWLGKCRDAAGADDSWAQADAAAWAQWLQDEAAFENQYNAKTQSTRDAWKIMPTAIANVTPNESTYQQVLSAWQNGPTPSPGGFDDLVRRAQAGPAAKDFQKEPAPVQPIAPDPDLAALQALDNIPIPKDPTKLPWGTIALVAGGALGVLFVAKKVLP